MNRWLNDLRMALRMNWILTVATALLMAIGVAFIYSACNANEEFTRELHIRQALWIGVGAACFLGFALLDYEELRTYSWWFYSACALLLLLVLIIGTVKYGARRWLVFLGFTMQPSEFAKAAVILVLARKLSRPGANLGEFKFVAILLGIVALPVILTAKEPDLGTALIFVPVAIVMMFAAGVPLRILGGLTAVAAVGLAIMLAALFLPARLGMDDAGQHRVMKIVGMREYHRDRLSVFFSSDVDPLGVGWNKRQSQIAVGSGGTWGKGFQNGTQNILGFLPRSVAPTDFIYSVIAEEKGFFGSVVVLTLFATIITAGALTAMMARDKFGRLLCAGVTTMIFCHVFINIAMTVGLMPIMGVPLPLLSYGGSFMVVVASLLGMVQSVYIRSRSTAEAWSWSI